MKGDEEKKRAKKFEKGIHSVVLVSQRNHLSNLSRAFYSGTSSSSPLAFCAVVVVVVVVLMETIPVYLLGNDRESICTNPLVSVQMYFTSIGCWAVGLFDIGKTQHINVIIVIIKCHEEKKTYETRIESNGITARTRYRVVG